MCEITLHTYNLPFVTILLLQDRGFLKGCLFTPALGQIAMICYTSN